VPTAKATDLGSVDLKTIIPLAGNGLRLRPVTESKPKALIEVAGKPVLEHILLNLSQSPVNELVLIVGYMREHVIEWVEEHFANRFHLTYAVQDKQIGLGHAIYCAREYLDDEIIITLGDEIFSKPYTEMIPFDKENKPEVSIGIKQVDDPTHYGMVTLGNDGFVKELVEKPTNFEGNTAIGGVYYIREGAHLLKALKHIISIENGDAEYQLTDALQYMLEMGTHMSTFNVGDWYDCGRLETLMESNHRLLEKNHFISETATIVNSEIIEPCIIGPNTRISNSRIGPYVSIGADVTITNCIIWDAILESKTVLKDHEDTFVLYSEHGALTRATC
jgi:glucose-1-phosphate thymidylyltransferase